MTNYYVELGLERSASIEQLEKDLLALRQRWVKRSSSAATTEKRQHAERMVELIREATETLLVKDNKEKYDKELDKNPSAASKVMNNQADLVPTPAYGGMEGAALLDNIEQLYENSHYNQAIALANQALAVGNNSFDVYRYLILSHIERGDTNNAMKSLQKMIQDHPDDAEAHELYARICLQVLDGQHKAAKPSIDWLLNSPHAESGPVVALDVEYCIDNNDLSLAETKVNQYLAGNNSDKDFRQSVSRAYAQYADQHYLTEHGGDVYFDKQEDINGWVSMYKKAVDIYPDSTIRKRLEDIGDLKKRKLLPKSWMGILCATMYAFTAIASGLISLGVFMFALNAALIYYSFVPQWQYVRFQYTNHLVGIYEIARYVNIVLSVTLRLGWAATKVLIKLALPFSFS